MIRTTTTRRRGFTLVELLVAIALGIVLLGIAVGVSQSSAFESYKVVGSADRLSQWMLTAKNRALRDRTPRGIRLLPDATNPNLVKEIAYIEQPAPWIPTPNRTINADLPRLIVQRIVTQSPPQVAGGGESTRVFLINIPDPTGIISIGDTLNLPEVGQSYVITTITPNPSSSASDANPAPVTGPSPYPPVSAATPTPNVIWQINSVVELGVSLTSSTDLGQRFGAGYAQTQPGPPFSVAATYHTTNFAVYRQPRPLMGEPTQLLTSGMAIDIGASLNLPPAVNGNRDILFAPSGEIIGSGDGVMAFVMRDSNLLPTVSVNPRVATDVAGAGQMILVCTYPRTGAINTQPINPPVGSPSTADPFQFAKDGINTGL